MIGLKHCQVVEKKRSTMGAKLETAKPSSIAAPSSPEALADVQDADRPALEADPAQESVFEVRAIPDAFLGSFFSITFADSLAKAYERWVEQGQPALNIQRTWFLAKQPKEKDGVPLIDIRTDKGFIGWVVDSRYALLLQEQREEEEISSRSSITQPPSSSPSTPPSAPRRSGPGRRS